MDIKKTALVEKKNILNELRSNNMTLQELRFFSIYLSQINARNVNSRVVSFQVSNFQKIMEISQAKISHMLNTTNRLLCKIITIWNSDGGYESFQLFKKCKVYKKENGEWWVEINAHDDALPYLFEYKEKYFTYQLWNALRLKSANQLRMYEILKQYEKAGERELTIEKLRALIGIGKDEYPQWERFRTKVLDKCREALAENTDIKFTYEPIKRGKGGKIVALKFKIEKNKDYVDQLTLDEFIDIQQGTEAIYEPEYSEIKNELILDQDAPDQNKSFENENLEFLAEACNGEFDEKQMDIIKSYLVKLVPFDSKTHQTDQYDYLLSKYKELNYRAKRLDLTPIKSRFAYLKSLFEIEIKNMGAEDENKW